MTKDEVLKLALEALESLYNDSELMVTHRQHKGMKNAITAIREALAQPEQEPVAWSYWQSCLNDDGTQTAPWVHRLSKFKPNESIINKDIFPLYTTPPQRKPLPPQSPCEMTQAEGKMFKLGWLECEAAHGIKE